MLLVPFPFIVAILLLVLFVFVMQREDGKQRNLPFLALILVGAAQSFLSGLRWGYGVEFIRYIAPALAAAVPALAYCGVSRLVSKPDPSSARYIGVHALPSLVILALTFLWRDALDFALVLIFVGYGVAILLLMRPGTDALRMAPFDGVQNAFYAIMFTALFLFVTAALDVFIFLDFAWTRGQNAMTAITAGNLVGLLFLAVAAATASRSSTPEEPKEVVQEPDSVEDREVLAALENIMTVKKIYRDPDLNLDRLARKTGITARHISSAINRALAKNVSQYVNEHRISEACDLLENSEKSVTEIMFDVGFHTKSNFNREFRRVTDMSPLSWRETNKTTKRQGPKT